MIVLQNHVKKCVTSILSVIILLCILTVHLKHWAHVRDKSSTYKYDGPLGDYDDIDNEIGSHKERDLSRLIQLKINATPECNLSQDKITSLNNVEEILNGFHECIDPIFASFNGEARLWYDNWVKASRKCDYIDAYKNLNVNGIANGDEIKWIIYPRCRENNTHLSLGIGHDTLAEEKLKMHQPNTKFIGVDPMIDINYDIYTKNLQGSFFGFALSNETGLSTFSVLRRHLYGPEEVTTLDVAYFFEKVLKIRRIDSMFLDIEGGEQFFFDYFHKGGKFDQIGTVICQFNVELHAGGIPNGYQKAYDFFKQTLKDNRYIFMRGALHTPGFFKIYFVNVEDKECVRKFLQ